MNGNKYGKKSVIVNIKNKKALFDYEILKEFEAGVKLFGFEVKAVRCGMANLDGGHIVVRGGEAFLLNTHIGKYQPGNTPKEYDEHRPRKLLLHKKEIDELQNIEDKKGLTIIPIAWYNRGGFLKLKIAIARGRKKRDKRELLKERDDKLRINRTLKSRFVSN